MKTNTKISIVLPTYNGERWLAESIQSIIDQTEKNWELIIVNDCSTDNTLKIATSFANKDPRIVIITNKTNLKLPASLNIGFEKASGKYLTWTSDDNLYKPNALEIMLKYLDNHPATDMVSMNMDIIDEKGKILTDSNCKSKYLVTPQELLYFNNIGAVFMYRKTIADKIGKYDINSFCAEDYDYWCRITLNGKIDYTNDNIYQYRIHNQSLTATKKINIKKISSNIQKKYLNDFLKKYNYTKRDIALFWYNIEKHNRPKQYRLYYFYFSVNKYLVNFLFFWNQKIRRSLRIVTNNKYSFSQPKDK